MSETRWECARRFVSRGVVLVAGSSSAILSGAVAFVERAALLLVVLGLLALALGIERLLRGLVHRSDPAYRADAPLFALVVSEIRLAACWIAVSAAVMAAAAAGVLPLAVALGGATALTPIVLRSLALTLDIARRQDTARADGSRAFLAQTKRVRRWIDRAENAQHIPAVRSVPRWFVRREARNQVTRHTGRVLTAIVCVTLACAGIAGAQVLDAIIDEPRPANGSEPASTGPFTYEQLCPALPDPLAIGQGLGELFAHAGAVEAGCGQRARRVVADVPVWTADGVCEGELRSLGISFPGDAVLLFGQAARVARERAVDGTLRFAERGFLGGGEVIVVGTVAGTWVLVRTTPALRRGRRRPLRCEEVDEVARPFTVLRPALAALWVQLVRAHGWSWPLPDASRGPGAVVFLDPDTRQVVAHGDCTGDASCEVTDADGRRQLGGVASISIDSLAPYAP
jgi:hypothetical protein